MKKVKSLEEWRLLIKQINETIKNEAKKQKNTFLIAATIFGNVLSGRAVIRGREVTRAAKGTKSWSKSLTPSSPLTNFET